MDIYIPNKDELVNLIEKSVERAILRILPDAIRKGTRNQWLTTSEVMHILQCSRRHIQYLRDTHQLPYSRLNKMIRFDIHDVEEYLNKNKVKSLNSNNQNPSNAI